jgi:Reverse transcriptase (RNA-dependent DNA polymerase)
MLCAHKLFPKITDTHSCLTIIDKNTYQIDTQFIFATASDIINNCDKEPYSIEECKRTADWPKWQTAIASELKSLEARGTFIGPVETPVGTKPIGCRWVFIRYKARLEAQGFFQRPGLDFVETYSPVMDITSYKYLISLSLNLNCMLHITDVETAYLKGNLDRDIYIRKSLQEYKSLKDNKIH